MDNKALQGKNYAPPICGSLRSLYHKLAPLRFSPERGVRYQMEISLLHKALEYKCWADRRTLDVVGTIDPVQGAASLAFARQQLNHMVRVEENFRARLQSTPEPHPSTNTDLVPSLQELDQRLKASNE